MGIETKIKRLFVLMLENRSFEQRYPFHRRQSAISTSVRLL